MSRIAAVTGATGFVGSHVVRRMADAGWQVRLLTRRLPVHPSFASVAVDAVIGDLDDSTALRHLTSEVDVVIHVAGSIKARSLAEFFAANSAGTQRLVEIAASQQSVPRFILISTIAAREPSLSDYAASKKAGEDVLKAKAAGMPWTVLRPPAVYGPGDRETLSFFQLMQRGVALLPTAEGRVSLIHVADLASAIVHTAGTPELTGAVTELDDGQPSGYSWNDLVNAAATPIGVNPYRMVMPGAVSRIMAMFASAGALINREPPMLTLQKVRELRHIDWVCHDTRPIAASGWKPTIGIVEGFAKTIAWYRVHGWL